MMAARLLSGFLLSMACASMLHERTAFAQTPSSSPSSQAVAAECEKRGFEAARRGDAETARREFAKAYAVLPTPKALWNLLVMEIDSNHPLDALKHLRSYMADPNAEPKRVEQGKALLVELTAQTAQLQIVAPEIASVVLDGVTLPSTQRPIDVMPGKHVVEVMSNTGADRKEVQAPAGKETIVSFDLERRDKAPAVVAPVEPKAAAATPTSSREPVVHAASARESGGLSSPPVATWILGGVAVAALGAGVAFSLSSQSKEDEVAGNPNACGNAASAECARIQDAQDAGKRDSTIGWIAYAGAGAAAIAGGLIWGLSPKAKPAVGRATMTPIAGGGVAGLRFQTSF